MQLFIKAIFLFVSLVPLLITGFGYATKLPDDLMYQGKPIDALCLFQIEAKEADVDLSKCGLNSKEGHLTEPGNKKLLSEGFVGYDYHLIINDSKYLQGYSYYKVISHIGNSYVVQTVNNSGGSGSFSFLNLVQRDGNMLHLSVLDGGDRCNGSLVDLKQVGKGELAHLVYSVYLTPYDFLSVAKDNPNHVKAYDDLAACAVCCAGKAVFERHIGPDFEHKILVDVDVSAYVKDLKNMSHTELYQACFNHVLLGQVNQHDAKLNAKELLHFTHEFNTQCVRKIAQF